MATTSPAASCPSESRGFSVGLTGGIGSGKSAVAELFVTHGAAIIDTDAIAHQLTAARGEAIGPIASEFGGEFINPDGALDRPKMRQLVFRDAAAKAQLESILHPRIRARTRAAAQEAFRRSPYVVFVVPLLIERGDWRERLDRVLVVDCAIETQVTRVCARSGLEEPVARAIIAQQATRTERLDGADDVLVNEARVEALAPRVRRLHLMYQRAALRAGHRL